MDLATRYRQKQIAVWALVGVTAVLANIPREWAERLHLHTEFLLGVLGLLIVLALFFFARFSYFLTTVLLIVGANLPDRWAQGLSIDKTPLIVALVITILGSLLNQISKILPTGLEPKVKERNPEGIRAMATAIPRGQIRAVRTVIGMNVDLDDFDENGRSPLMIAAQTGQAEIVELLLANGASVDLKSPQGQTATEIALEAGQAAIVARLREASLKAENERAAAAATPPTAGDVQSRL